ncbi:MAG: hypothetical protein ACRDQB_04775 [Thermocrispum sp.]
MTVATPPREAEYQDHRPRSGRPDKAPDKRRFGRNRTTPGVLGALLIAVVVASLAVGAICALSVQSRDQTLQDLATADGELHAAAGDFYRSLATADVAAGAAFLARDEGMATDRVRYETQYEGATGEAQSALATLVAAAGDETDAGQRDLLGTLPGRLSEYTVLVEQARAYNRLDEPVASTYQLLAADSMRFNLLPAAKELHESVNAKLTADQDSSAELPYLELALGLFVLLVLISAQVYLHRRTNRVFNVGLVLATAAATAMVVWIGLASFTAGQDAEHSRAEGTAVINALAEARITGLSARANEALIPVASRDDHNFDAYEKSYQQLTKRLTGANGQLAHASAAADDIAVRESIDEAISSADTWTGYHDGVQQAAAGSEQRQAVNRLIISEADAAFGAFDDALGAAIDDTRLQFEADASSASAALTGVVIGVIGLALLTAAGAAIGVWQRLREYR